MNKTFSLLICVCTCVFLSGCFSIISRNYTVEYQRDHFVYKPQNTHRLQRKCDRIDFDSRIDTSVFYEGKGFLIKFFENGRFINFIGYPRIRYKAIKNVEQSVYEYPGELVNDLNQYTLGWYFVRGNKVHCSYFRNGLFGPIMERFVIQIDSDLSLHFTFEDIDILDHKNKEFTFRKVCIPNCNIHSTDANW